MAGYITQVIVNDGDYVEAGQPIAVVSQNNRLQLRADLPEKYWSSANRIYSANFKPSYASETFSLKNLGGRLISAGRTAAKGTFYIPVIFEFNNAGNFVPGAFCDIYLIEGQKDNVISVPETALTEEQGVYFVYLKVCETEYKKQEVKIGERYDKKPIELAPNKKNLIALSRTGESSIEEATNVKVEDINNLLETIPDDIEVDLKPVVRYEEYYTAELGKPYEMKSSYEVDVPLSFEQGLNIVYNDSIQDLNKDLNDLDKVGLKNVKVILSVDNAIPLKLQLKAENVQIKDVYGNELSAVKKTIEEDKQYVAESTDGEKPATSELVLSLTSDDTAFLSKIDRICFKITAVPGSTTGVPLKDTQWLKITSIKLSVPGGVNVDLN